MGSAGAGVRVNAEALEARAAMYGLLSGAFAKELTADQWTQLCGGETRDRLQGLAVRCDVEDQAVPLLRVLSQPVAASAVGELAVDYARLFIGPGPGLAPPYESLYHSPERRFYGEAVSKVLAVLQGEGVKVGDGFTAPPDHVSVELSIMQLFAKQAAAQLAEGTARQSLFKGLRFLDVHLLQWVPAWVVDVRMGASHGFYRETAGLLEEFLRRDADWLRAATRRSP